MYYPSGKILLELSPSIDGTVNSKIYYENGQLMQVEDRSKNGRSVKVYDKAGNLIAENIFNKDHEIKQIYWHNLKKKTIIIKCKPFPQRPLRYIKKNINHIRRI